MKKIVVVIALIFSTVTTAQISFETLVGDKQAHQISYWQKDIDKKGKWNLFNMSRFAIDYETEVYNNFSIESQLTYQLKDWVGISSGAGYRGEEFSPMLGLSLRYANKKGNFFIQSFPTVEFTDIKSFNFFGIIGYNSKINEKWEVFSQLIFSTMLTIDDFGTEKDNDLLGLFTAHQQSSQLIRAGLSYKNKFQFGIGTDLYQFYKNQGNFTNTGVFVRVQL